jgi:hypothetical protein
LTSTQLLKAGKTLAPVLFDHLGQQTASVDKQKALSGFPFIRHGYRSVLVDVSVRSGSDTAAWGDPPDTTADDDWSWSAVVSPQAAPVGDITITPSPPPSRVSRDFGQAAWVGGSVVGVSAAGFLITALATRWRRRRPAQPGS